MRYRLAACLVLGAMAGCGSASDSPVAIKSVAVPKAISDPSATLQVVKWPELERAIASQLGKVVVIDVWAEY